MQHQHTTLLSVIIPVFNDQSSLDKCLTTLKRQTFEEGSFEVIVIDNKSSPPMVVDKSRFPFVRLIICDKQGSYAARNAGASFAQGTIYAFIDADCIADPDWLFYGVSRLREVQPGCFIGGEVQIEEPAVRTPTALYQYLVGFQQQENIDLRAFSATANMFCTREQFSLVGPFDERLLSGGDREWAWRAKSYGIVCLYEPLAIVRTKARITLGSAIRQARRVAGGRMQLKLFSLAHQGINHLKPHRTIGQSTAWIIKHPKLSFWEKLQVLGVAAILKAINLTERIRLVAGFNMERR